MPADNDDFAIVSIKINQENKGAIINEIKTIHLRKDYTLIIDKALNEKRLLKVNRSKIKDLLTSHQLDIISSGAASLLNISETK